MKMRWRARIHTKVSSGSTGKNCLVKEEVTHMQKSAEEAQATVLICSELVPGTLTYMVFI